MLLKNSAFEQLALFGGPKAIKRTPAAYNSYGEEEKRAALDVIESGVLSQYLGAWHADFYGGPKVRAFEKAWADYFKVKHAVSVNSATSGLIAAVGALGIEPGDEVIVSPWTMCATATSILVWNAVPVFADIEDETFTLDVGSIEKNITPRTKAIIVTDIFGHAADLKAIMALAKKHRLKVIEDAAQAPAARYNGQFVGTAADIGVFSLNYHKHIHTGEGGMCVTADSKLAERMQLIRNHAEAVVEGKNVKNISNMIGFNFRLGEIEAAMGIEQLKKLKTLTDERIDVARQLSEGLGNLPGLQTPVVKNNCTHVYYFYPLTLNPKKTGVPRAKLVAALKAEGVPALVEGYANVHRLPMYQKKIAYGKKGFPWTGNVYSGKVSYKKGICPVAEALHDETFVGLALCKHDFSRQDTQDLVKAFHKVWWHMGKLRR